MIHTEQLSSSRKLNLLLEKVEHSYSRRDFIMRHSNPSPRLTQKVYEVAQNHQEKSINNENNSDAMDNFGSKGRNSKKLNRKTKTYWNKIKSELQQLNTSLQI